MADAQRSKTHPVTSTQSPAAARRKVTSGPGSAIKPRDAPMPRRYATTNFRDVKTSTWYEGTAIEVDAASRSVLVAFKTPEGNAFGPHAFWVTIAGWMTNDLTNAEPATDEDPTEYSTTKPQRTASSSILTASMPQSTSTMRDQRGGDGTRTVKIQGRKTKYFLASNEMICTASTNLAPRITVCVSNPASNARANHKEWRAGK